MHLFLIQVACLFVSAHGGNVNLPRETLIVGLAKLDGRMEGNVLGK